METRSSIEMRGGDRLIAMVSPDEQQTLLSDLVQLPVIYRAYKALVHWHSEFSPRDYEHLDHGGEKYRRLMN